jgi:hypothetical protein
VGKKKNIKKKLKLVKRSLIMIKRKERRIGKERYCG